MRKYLCWLLGHSYICLFSRWWQSGANEGSETTGWTCQHCGKQRFEQWDS